MTKRATTEKSGSSQPRKPKDPLIGKQVGKYEIVDVIRRNDHISVYRAHPVDLDQFVTLTLFRFRPGIANDSDFTALFDREMKAVASLQHPHINPVLDYAPPGFSPFIVTKDISGSLLKDNIHQSVPADWPDISRTIQQITDALDYAHRNSVIHRDLTSSNIVLDQQKNVLITDFGVNRILAFIGNLIEMGVGTPAYMSPEQWRGEVVDYRSDIYSLGVVLFEMLTGRVPFNDPSPMVQMFKHLNEPPPDIRNFNSSMPLGMNHIILRALAKKPADRYTSVIELGLDVAHVLDSKYMLSDEASSQPTQKASTLTSTGEYFAVSESDSAPPVSPPQPIRKTKRPPASKTTPPPVSSTTTPSSIRKTAPPPVTQPEPANITAFVSYSSKNRSERTNLVEQLGKLNKVVRNVWFDDGLKQHGGQEWWNVILEQVRSRDLFVFVLTPESLLSFACYLEYTYAHALNKWILPVKMQSFEIPLLPLALKGTQIVDFTGDDKVTQLQSSVEDIARQRTKTPPFDIPASPPVPYDDFTPVAVRLLNTTETIPMHDQHALYSMLESFSQDDRTRDGSLILLDILQSRGDTVHQVGRKVEKLLENINKPNLMGRIFGRKGK